MNEIVEIAVELLIVAVGLVLVGRAHSLFYVVVGLGLSVGVFWPLGFLAAVTVGSYRLYCLQWRDPVVRFLWAVLTGTGLVGLVISLVVYITSPGG